MSTQANQNAHITPEIDAAVDGLVDLLALLLAERHVAAQRKGEKI